MVIAPDPGSSGLRAPFSKVSEVPVPNFLVVVVALSTLKTKILESLSMTFTTDGKR